MFRWPVHPRDLVELARRQRGGAAGLGRLLRPSRGRVVGRWETELRRDLVPRHWYEIPRVVQRWNRLTTGSEDLSFPDFVAGRFFADGRSSRRGLSIGCGTGANERAWFATGAFAELVGVDLSAERVERATRASTSERLRFVVDDIATLSRQEGSLDLLLAIQSLHHVASLAEVIPRFAGWLAPEGLLVLDEYVGPRRFQWSRRQLEAANALLARMPRRYRMTPEGWEKRTVWRPGWGTVRLHDPSEAVESHLIIGTLDRELERRYVGGYGGNLLHLVLKDLAHHFTEPEPEAGELLEELFEAEDRYLSSGESSDFVRAVYGRREAGKPSASDIEHVPSLHSSASTERKEHGKGEI